MTRYAYLAGLIFMVSSVAFAKDSPKDLPPLAEATGQTGGYLIESTPLAPALYAQTTHRLVQDVRRYAYLAKLRYESGQSSNLEVLDSERNQYAAEQGLAQIQSAALVATVTLYKALGGDWGVN